MGGDRSRMTSNFEIKTGCNQIWNISKQDVIQAGEIIAQGDQSRMRSKQEEIKAGEDQTGGDQSRRKSMQDNIKLEEVQSKMRSHWEKIIEE